VSDRLQNFPTDRSQALISYLQAGTETDILARLKSMLGAVAGKAVRFDTTDGLRIYFDNDDIVHLRPSGNAPELRCYTESADVEAASTLNQQILHLVANSDSNILEFQI
jgi:phosphomannomutase